MTKPPGVAKAKPKKPRARKAAATKTATKPERSIPQHLLVPVNAGDWPLGLDDKTAETLFDLIECGNTMLASAKKLGMKPNTISQWKRRHPKFRERLEEALDIGNDVMIDQGIEIGDTAVDRDSAAASKERREARREYRRDRWPERFHINPFKPAIGSGDGALLGIVLVPMKASQSEPLVIEGTAVRVPHKRIGAE